MKNYTLPTKLKIFFTLMDCRVLISNIFKLKPFAGFMLTSSHCGSVNQSSTAQVALMVFSNVHKTFIFPSHSTVACAGDCPWDTHMTRGDTQPVQKHWQTRARTNTQA